MTEAAVETYDTTTRGAASMAAYRAVRILQLLSENNGEDKAMLSDELIRRLAHPDDPACMPISAARRSICTCSRQGWPAASRSRQRALACSKLAVYFWRSASMS